jgi:hypothetical protein
MYNDFKIGDKVKTYNVMLGDIMVIITDLYIDDNKECFSYIYNNEDYWQYCDEAEKA